MFNNREIASAIWLAFFTLWILTKPDIRISILGVFRALLNRKILICLAAMFLYTVVIVAALNAIGFWQLPMIKDTALWFCFNAFAMVMRFSTSNDSDSLLRKVVVDNIKLVVFLEILCGHYTFSLPAEIVFVPIATVIVMLDTFVASDEKYAHVFKCTTFVLSVTGFALLGFAVLNATRDLTNLGGIGLMRAIVLPPLMSIAFIPFVYGLMIFNSYESIFMWLAVSSDKPPYVVRYAKRRIFLHCGLSRRRLREFAKRPPVELMRVKSNIDVDRLFMPSECVNARQQRNRLNRSGSDAL